MVFSVANTPYDYLGEKYLFLVENATFLVKNNAFCGVEAKWMLFMIDNALFKWYWQELPTLLVR